VGIREDNRPASSCRCIVSGMVKVLLPQEFVTTYVGSNSLSALLIPVLFGVLVYFPTLVEVPMAKVFLDLGMGKGPLMAYLLADPVLSLPSILVVSKIMGTKRTVALCRIDHCTLRHWRLSVRTYIDL